MITHRLQHLRSVRVPDLGAHDGEAASRVYHFRANRERFTLSGTDIPGRNVRHRAMTRYRRVRSCLCKPQQQAPLHVADAVTDLWRDIDLACRATRSLLRQDSPEALDERMFCIGARMSEVRRIHDPSLARSQLFQLERGVFVCGSALPR